VIERYLDDLRRLLRGPGRRRIVAEVEAHLREAAARLEDAGMTPREADCEAVAAFGPPEDVAAGFASEQAARTLGWASRILLAAVVGFVPLYGLVENLAPPAPWASAADAPDHLTWKLAVTNVLVIAAGLLAVGVFVAARGYRREPGAAGRRARPLSAAIVLTGTVLAVAAALGAVETVQRAAVYRELAVPGTFTTLELAAVVASASVLGLAALGAVGWSLRAAVVPTRA
jgi:hypothetical protein